MSSTSGRPAATMPARTALTALYEQHYRGLLRLAVLVVGDRTKAEDVVHDAFLAVHRRWSASPRTGSDPDSDLAYVRRAVVNGARSRIRRDVVARSHLSELVTPAAPPDRAAVTADRDALARALANLPERQREAVVLRHYTDLTEKDTAAAMGCSVGAVKAYTSRGLATLATLLEENPS